MWRLASSYYDMLNGLTSSIGDLMSPFLLAKYPDRGVIFKI